MTRMEGRDAAADSAFGAGHPGTGTPLAAPVAASRAADRAQPAGPADPTHRPDPADADDLADLADLADADDPADLAAEREALRREVAVLRETMAARAAFDMACGIVMATGRCSRPEAVGALLDVARRTGATRGAVARLLVEGI
ncbi:ANTAR domain-containing protein, partial [Streptomyces sp. DvalAA-14]|uniref:ANTAR domain-containing protein n=1 Tax=unclassified Streptomyces TaxID=2593676 RepID=UPI00081B0E45